MKKLVKNLLFGAGIAAVGLAVYSLWKDAEEPVVVRNTDEESGITPSKEYVEHRRQQIRAAAEARRAAQEEAPVPAQEAAAPATEPSPTGETQEEVSAPAQETVASPDEAAEPPATEG